MPIFAAADDPAPTAMKTKGGNDIAERMNGDMRAVRGIRCTERDADSMRSEYSSDTYIDATTAILVTEGGMRFSVNRRTMTAEAGSVTLLSPAHTVRMEDCTDNLHCISLAVGEEFMRETDSVEMIYKRIRYGAKLFDRPVVRLSPEGMATVGSRLRELRHALDAVSHLYWREVVLNRLYGFYLDLSDIIDRTEPMPQSEHAARYESTVKRFIELLTAHYRSEHKVEFYASRLNISAHYLTLIVKEVTGRSASEFIFGMLYGDARTLLAESGMSVQEITSLLNFSDQSAFGKFFKRRSGLPPLEWRKKRH